MDTIYVFEDTYEPSGAEWPFGVEPEDVDSKIETDRNDATA